MNKKSYSHFTHNEEYPIHWTDRAVERISIMARAEEFKKLIPDNVKSILEVGCNAGYNLVSIKFTNNNYELTGVDNLDYAVEQAEQLTYGETNTNAKELGIKIISADGRNLPFLDSSFDLVLACGYLDWIGYDDILIATNELLRVSKKYILVIDYAFVGDMVPYGDLELIVTYKGNSIYVIRQYTDKFKNCEIINYVERLSEEFSVTPTSAWLFEKKNR